MEAGAIISLRGREAEPRVAELLATAQIHRPLDERAGRGPRIAEFYATHPEFDLWGYEDERGLIGIAGVEPAHADGAMLHDLAVLPGIQRSGIGSFLISFLRQHYPARALFGNTMDSALGFYRGLGFETHEESTMPSGAPVYRFRLEALEGARTKGCF